MKLLKYIFSITKDTEHNTITIFGIKFHFKRLSFNYGTIKQHVSNEIFALNCIKELHHKTFPKYKNSNRNKEVVILGTGPTLVYYTPIQNACHIGVNRAYKNEKTKLDYLFVVDFNETNKENIEEIINYPANIFLGRYFTLSKISRERSIPVKYRDLPNINYYAVDCPRNLCYPDLEFCGLMDFGSTIFNAAHFATYTHPQKIYLVGCDCSNTGHYDNSPPYNDINANVLINGWKIFKNFCNWYYPDIEIISINPVGLKGIFKDVYTQDYVNEHTELLDEDIEIFNKEDCEAINV